MPVQPNAYERLLSLVSLWTDGEDAMHKVIKDHLPVEISAEYEERVTASGASAFVSEKLRSAMSKKDKHPIWRAAATECLLRLAQENCLAVKPDEIEKALFGTVKEFWQFVGANNPNNRSGETQVATRLNGDDSLADFELMGCKEHELRTYLAAFRVGVFNVRDRELNDDGVAEQGGGNREPGEVTRCVYLYRLGFENLGARSAVHHNNIANRYGFAGNEYGLVVRRVPARFIFNKNDPHRAVYQEFYQISKNHSDNTIQSAIENGGPIEELELSAEAYCYAYSDYLAIVSRDMGGDNVVRPSLTQLDWIYGRNTSIGDGFIPGVIAMESDVYQAGTSKKSTAYRILMKKLEPDAEWESVRKTSYTKLLVGPASDGSPTRLDRNSWGEEAGEYGVNHKWSTYFDMLNICDNPLDLVVSRQISS